MDKIKFRYMNRLLFVIIWCILVIFFISILTILNLKISTVVLSKSFRSIFIFIIFISSYIISMILTDKNGTVIFYEDYFEIHYKKNIRIKYREIKDMKLHTIRIGSIRKFGVIIKKVICIYIIKIRTIDNDKISLSSSIKEAMENLRQGKISGIQKVHNKIESYIKE